jgi:DNA-binding winged helix-turn-helix (wHTH) protein
MADPGYPQPAVCRRYTVGAAEVRPDTNTVVVAGVERPLRPQAMQVLTFLLQRPDEVVPAEVLNREIWGDIAGTNDALVKCVAEIQRALDDRPRRPRFIRTVPKVGYSVIGPVSEFLESAGPSTDTTDPERTGPAWRQWVNAAVRLARSVIR